MQKKEMTVPFVLKKQSEYEGFFTYSGYASTYDYIDSDNDRIRKGAFELSIKDLAAKNKYLPALWQHNTEMPIGVYKSIKETDKGLYVKAALPKDDSFVSGRVMPQLSVGSISNMSVGFIMKEFESDARSNIRDITQAHLIEISLVTFPANDQAMITEVKSLVSFQDLPLADRGMQWDSGVARQKVAAWAGENFDEAEVQARYRRAFLWYDDNDPQLKGSYKFPIATVINGKLTAVPRAIFAAAARLNQADVSESDRKGIQRHLERYYKVMDMESPFSKSAFRVDDFSVLSERSLEHILKDGVSFSGKTSKQIISGLKSVGLRDVVGGRRDGAIAIPEDFVEVNKKLDEILRRSNHNGIRRESQGRADTDVRRIEKTG